MKFLCDVHISYKIVAHLNEMGFEAIHVNEILNKSETKDSEICAYADLNNYVVVTKDADFRNSYFIKKTPKKLIKINLGNISNFELAALLSKNAGQIKSLNNKEYFLLEVGKFDIILIE